MYWCVVVGGVLVRGSGWCTDWCVVVGGVLTGAW